MNVLGITPILNVSDMTQSLEWFDKLGWKKGWDWGEPATFACVGNNELEIFLCLNGQGGRGKGSNTRTFDSPESESADQGVWMSLWVDDVDAIYARCQSAGLEVTQLPENMPWNVREMHIRHPDGHVMRISQALC